MFILYRAICSIGSRQFFKKSDELLKPRNICLANENYGICLLCQKWENLWLSSIINEYFSLKKKKSDEDEKQQK